MPALPAHEILIDVSDDDIVYNELCGINDTSLPHTRELLDTTDFKDTSGARRRIAGLLDTSFSASGDYYGADVAQVAVRAAFTGGTAIWIRVRWDGINGEKILMLVESHEISGSVDGKVEWSAEFQADGVPVAVP